MVERLADAVHLVVGLALGKHQQLGFELWQKTRPVCTEHLDSDVLVMQPANERMRNNAANSLNWARDRRIFLQ